MEGGGSETKACMARGKREESREGNGRKIHEVKDDGSETQLREVARKAAEDEEWKRGMARWWWRWWCAGGMAVGGCRG